MAYRRQSIARKSTLGRRAWLSLTLAGLIGTAALTLSPPAGQAAKPVVVAVVVGQGETIDNVSLPVLRRIFRAEPHKNGQGVSFVPVNHPLRTSLRTTFDQVVLGMSVDAVESFWVDQRIRGNATAPRALPSALIPNVIVKVPATVSYVSLDAVKPGMKLLRVNGKLPGEPGYPLQ